jgi:hypothetical protein
MNEATHDGSQADPAEKPEWQAPSLTTLGDAASLTLAALAGTGDGGGGSS